MDREHVDKIKKLLLTACRYTLPGFKKIERMEERLEQMRKQLDSLSNTSVVRKKHELYQYYSNLFEIGTYVGVRAQKRSPALTVSFTTMPIRLPRVHLTIESLLRQSIQPDRLILWLDHESFDSIELPIALRRQEERGLEIQYCDNLLSYKKLIPALEKYPQDVIVTCDDDAFYPRDWLEKLYRAHLADPQTVQCHRAHRILFEGSEMKPYRQWEYETKVHEPSFLVFPTGVGGILYPPGALHEDVLDRGQFLSLAPRADDVWFKAMCVKNGVRSHLVEKNAPMDKGEIRDAIFVVPDTQEVALYKTNYFQDDNDKQIRATFDAHGIIERLRSAA